MATATITAANAVTRKSWANTAFRQHMTSFPLFSITDAGNGGTTLRGAIVVEDFESGEGDSKVYAFRAPKSISTVKVGDQRVQGTGTTSGYGTDTVTLERFRDEMQVNNLTMSAIRTKLDIENDTAKDLGDQAARFTLFRVMSALTDVTSGRTANRYQYGSLAANYNATHSVALANVDATDDKLTLDLLRKSVTKMRTKSSGIGYMQPAKFTTANGATVYKFIGLFHPNAIIDLKSDPDFKNSVYIKDTAMFDVISGASYVGEFEGVAIYSVDPVDGENDTLLVAGAGAGGINVAHNLILGAGALVLARGKVRPAAGNVKYSMEQNRRMMITEVADDHGGDALWAWTVVQGYRKLVDNSTVAGGEDYATFHLFTSAAAGF